MLEVKFPQLYELLRVNYELKDVQILNIINGSNINILFKNRGECYCLRKFSGINNWSVSQINFEIQILNYLKKVNFPAPVPIKSIGKNFLINFPATGKDRYLLFEGIKGSEIFVLNKERIFKIGKMLAEMHLLFDKKFIDSRIKNVYNINHLLVDSFNKVKPFVEKNPNYPELKHVVNYIRSELELLPGSQPIYGLCHGDYHYKNILVEKENIYVIDFDTCGFGYRIMDIAAFLLGLIGEEYNFDFWETFIKGYICIRPLTASEYLLLPSMMASRYLWWLSFHAINWGRWEFTWLNNDFFDKGVLTLLDIYYQRI